MMSDKSSNTTSLALATILAALVTGAVTLMAAKMTIKGDISGVGDARPDNERIEQLLKDLENSRSEVAAQQERIALLEEQATNGNKGAVRSLLQRIEGLEVQLQSKDEQLQSKPDRCIRPSVMRQVRVG